VGKVFERVSPSVVIVRTKQREVATGGRGVVSFSEVGSGVLISADGKVLTAAHVVDTADEIVVELLTGEVVRAEVIASEPAADVSLLQLDRVPSRARIAKLGDSDAVRVGDEIFVVGAPYGIGHTLTVGHVSARHRPNTVYRGMAKAEFLQTDAAINQGNSGGPMFSMKGEVIGVVSHIISKSGGFEGLAFVVTSNMARDLLLVQKSFWSGVDGYVLSGDLAGVFNLPQAEGLLVQRLAKGSPAAAAGLQGGTMKATIVGQELTVGGDIILDVNGISYAGPGGREAIREALTRLPEGADIPLTVLRRGQLIKLLGRR
jgi:S1-C subfamily serine protease